MKIKNNIESFWLEVDEILLSDIILNKKITKIYSLISERLDRTLLLKYDTDFNLIEEQNVKNIANVQKEKIIKHIWYPLFNEAKTLTNYASLLNFVMPVNKRYPFCGDYELTDKIYSIISDIVDENTPYEGIIDFLRPEEFYDISERDYGTYSKLLDILSKNMLKQASIKDLVYYIDPFDEYFNIIMQFNENDILKYLKKVKSKIDKSDLEEILERLEDCYGFEFIEEFR